MNDPGDQRGRYPQDLCQITNFEHIFNQSPADFFSIHDTAMLNGFTRVDKAGWKLINLVKKVCGDHIARSGQSSDTDLPTASAMALRMRGLGLSP